MAIKADAPRAQVPVFLVVLQAHVAEQTDQHRQVKLLIAGGLVVQMPALFTDGALQLRMDVPPFAHAAHVDVVLAQQGFVLTIGQLMHCVMATARIPQPFPQLEVTNKLALLIVKFRMRLIGLRLPVHRPVAHVLHAQCAGNHQHFIQCAAVFGFQNHPAHARVQRQFGKCPAHGGQFVVVIDCAQFGQQLVAVGHCAALRWFDEGKVFNRAQVQRLHAQNDRGQRAAQNLGVGEALPPHEVRLVIQAYANAVCDPATAPGPLVGRSL